MKAVKLIDVIYISTLFPINVSKFYTVKVCLGKLILLDLFFPISLNFYFFILFTECSFSVEIMKSSFVCYALDFLTKSMPICQVETTLKFSTKKILIGK